MCIRDSPNRVYALVEAKPGGGLYRSDDAGQTWKQFSSYGQLITRPFYYVALAADPTNADGANVSQDGGRTWSTQMNQPTAEIYGVWLDEQFPYRLYGAQQDASTVIVPSMPVPGMSEPFESGPGCETGPIIPHPKNPQIVYGACKGQFGRMFMNTRQEQNYWVGGQSLYGNDAKDPVSYTHLRAH